MKPILFLIRFTLFLSASWTITFAAEDAPPPQTLFTNVMIFDGENEALMAGNVLVEGNLIKQISEEAIDAPNATVIIGGGRTLLPGFIEAHAHLMLMGPSLPAMEAGTTWEDFAIHGTRMAEMYLMQGFTTVRDAGGSNAGLRRAIDSGQIPGPRFYPSGRISVRPSASRQILAA